MINPPLGQGLVGFQGPRGVGASNYGKRKGARMGADAIREKPDVGGDGAGAGALPHVRLRGSRGEKDALVDDGQANRVEMRRQDDARIGNDHVGYAGRQTSLPNDAERGQRKVTRHRQRIAAQGKQCRCRELQLLAGPIDRLAS